MDLNKETIDRVAELAAALTPPSDIAALLGIPADMLKAELADRLSPLRAAYLKAKAETALMFARQLSRHFRSKPLLLLISPYWTGISSIIIHHLTSAQ